MLKGRSQGKQYVLTQAVPLLPSCVAARLKRDYNQEGGLPVLLSTEKPRCKLVASEEMEKGNPLDFQVRISHQKCFFPS